jgi:hypothetical protein
MVAYEEFKKPEINVLKGLVIRTWGYSLTYSTGGLPKYFENICKLKTPAKINS